MEENQELDMNHLVQVRREKLDKLREEGKDPFQITKFNRTHTTKQIIDKYKKRWQIADIPFCIVIKFSQGL